MYLSPALTPRNPTHDPAVRLFHFDRRAGAIVNFTDYSFDVRQANAEGSVRWRASSPLRTAPLNLSSLSPTTWHDAVRWMLETDHAPTSSREIAPSDPFLQWMRPERCQREVYIDSGDARVPPLRRCKLAQLCSMLHVEDAPYARCLGLLACGREAAEARA